MPYISGLMADSPITAEEEAYRFLLESIFSGELKSGDRVIAEDIAARIGMSRMPVREAFRRLNAEGLITLRPNRGAVVSGLQIGEMVEVFEMRSALEGLAIRVATPSVTPRQLGTLERLLDEMDACREDSGEWVRRHRQFHEYLCSLSQRPRLMRQIDSLYSLIEPHMRLWLAHIDSTSKSRDDHQVIVEALRTGDPLQAELCLKDHVESTLQPLIDFLNKS